MATNDTQDFDLVLRLDSKPSDTHLFCQVLLKIKNEVLGDPDNWSVSGAVAGAISSMVANLNNQSKLKQRELKYLLGANTDDLFKALHDWQWGGGIWRYQEQCDLSITDPACFYALPVGPEIFDGEHAYIIHHPSQPSRFIWKGYGTEKVQDYRLDFDLYIEKWCAIKNHIEAAIKKKNEDLRF